MQPLYLRNEDAVYSYLKKFLKEKPGAVQLDGATSASPNAGIIAYFTYSVDGKKYKLCGDLSRKAVQAFVKLVDEHGSAAVAFKEYTADGYDGLILATSRKPDGWYCPLYVAKASDRLKKVA